MSVLKFSCFSGWDEWSTVKNDLFSGDVSMQCRALSIIRMWRSRGGIPASVDSTAQLVDVMIQDQSSTESQGDIRLMYSIVILRAVNLIVEPSQQGFYAESVLTLAQRAGIPGWIVELRHEASHKQLPSLSLLRSAAQFLLKWYEEHYWQPQYEYIRASSLMCMECYGNMRKNKKALRDVAIQIARGGSFLVDIIIPMLLTSIDTSCKELLQQHQSRGSIESVVISAATSMAINLFSQWENLIQVVFDSQNQLEKDGIFTPGAGRNCEDKFIVSFLSQIFEAFKFCDGPMLIAIQTMFAHVWLHKILEVSRNRKLKQEMQLSLSVQRQFLGTVLNLFQRNHHSVRVALSSSSWMDTDVIDTLFEDINRTTEQYITGNNSLLNMSIAHGLEFLDSLVMSDHSSDSKTNCNLKSNSYSVGKTVQELGETGLDEERPAKRSKSDPHYERKIGLWPLGVVIGSNSCLDLFSLEVISVEVCTP